MQQTGKVMVRAWDVKAKTLIQSQVDIPRQIDQGGTALDDDYGKARRSNVMQVSNVAGLTGASAKQLATALSADIQTDFFEAEGQCTGSPKIRAGSRIKLNGLGMKFSGEYAVMSARHHYSPRGGYTVSFTLGGHQANTLTHLLSRQDSSSPQRVYGVVVGIVTNNNDAVGLGRIKVRFPWLGDQIESAWCRVATPMAGSGRGFFYIPEIDDEVLIAFEQGDPNVPYMLGALWSTADKPPQSTSDVVEGGKVNKRILRSRSGHEITLCDESGKESILIKDKTGKNSLLIDSAANAMKIAVEGECSIDAHGECVIQAREKLQIKSASSDVSVECINFSVKASANCTIQGSAQLNLSSANLGFSSNGPLALDGSPVQINQTSLVVMP